MDSNPALASLEPLLGHWQMELYGAEFLPTPDTRITGWVDIDWVDAITIATSAPAQ